MEQNINQLDPYHFYFELPLYTKIVITEDKQDAFEQLIKFNGELVAFNPTLLDNTTYQLQGVARMSDSMTSIRFFCSYVRDSTTRDDRLPFFEEFFSDSGGVYYTRLNCKRESKPYYVYISYDSDSKILQKIGQYPSIADFHIAKVKDYSKVLNKEKMKEFTRAIGLVANGVGVGSFVYLRRIFEHLLEEAHPEAMKSEDWNEEEYRQAKVKDKILLLKDYLPNFLIENIGLYGILSKGIHELEENECLGYFEVVRTGIELILDEKLNEYERKKKQEEAKKKIDALTNKLASK